MKKTSESDGCWFPKEYVENDYEDRGDVVIDHATGLMWQKSGPNDHMLYDDAIGYVRSLNMNLFAHYYHWRIPSAADIISLLEPERQSNGLYINPVFSIHRKKVSVSNEYINEYWTSNGRIDMWDQLVVDFYYGALTDVPYRQYHDIDMHNRDLHGCFIMACRSIQC